jgi:hypothetical protein
MMKNRSNFDTMLDVNEVANQIYDVIFNEKYFSLNEIIIRKKGWV